MTANETQYGVAEVDIENETHRFRGQFARFKVLSEPEAKEAFIYIVDTVVEALNAIEGNTTHGGLVIQVAPSLLDAIQSEAKTRMMAYTKFANDHIQILGVPLYPNDYLQRNSYMINFAIYYGGRYSDWWFPRERFDPVPAPTDLSGGQNYKKAIEGYLSRDYDPVEFRQWVNRIMGWNRPREDSE